MNFPRHSAALAAIIVVCASTASAQEPATKGRPGIAPDIRDDESDLKLQRGDVVVVPIPISNPTLGTGLVLASAYFYAQTEAQEAVQPASVTAAAAVYTTNNSRALALVQQNYWDRDKWRFTGAAGAAALRLPLIAPDDTSSGESVDWRIDGRFLFATLSRGLGGDWYGGLNSRLIDADQSLQTSASSGDFDTDADVRSVGVGFTFEFDSRDMPINTYDGRYLKATGLFNDERFGSKQTYQSYSLALRSYHELTESVVLAWEAQGCRRGGTAPLWDACTIRLRGFSVTDYLGKETASGQVEARWRMSKRWGLVGFGGAGYVGNSFGEVREHEAIPSYGIGVRFMVLPAKRVNLRVDFARSTDSDAIHVSVGEAF